jgi:hypothetical protein
MEYHPVSQPSINIPHFKTLDVLSSLVLLLHTSASMSLLY